MANEEKPVQTEVIKPAEPVVVKLVEPEQKVTPPVVIPKARKIRLDEFLNERPEIKAGKVEILGAFAHHMEIDKKITHATEEEFRQELEKFKKLPV